MDYIWIVIILLYIALSHVIAQYIGTKRRIGYGKSILWSVLFSPIIGFIVTILSKQTDKQ